MASADLHGILLFALISRALDHPPTVQPIEPSLIRRLVYTNDLYTIPITPSSTDPNRFEVRLGRQIDCNYLVENWRLWPRLIEFVCMYIFTDRGGTKCPKKDHIGAKIE